ncbi:unnamed protein product, partial [Callosobruchus maculatus]
LWQSSHHIEPLRRYYRFQLLRTTLEGHLRPSSIFHKTRENLHLHYLPVSQTELAVRIEIYPHQRISAN